MKMRRRSEPALAAEPASGVPRVDSRVAPGGRGVSGPRGLALGRWRVDAIDDGSWWLDGGQMFGRVPRALWERVAAPDEKNRVLLASRAFLLRSPDACILVDSGPGRTHDARMIAQLGLPPRSGIEDGLTELGVATDKLNYVIMTHLHYDHAGGCVRRDDAGRIVPAFPNARHIVQRREWIDAHTENPLTRRSYTTYAFDPVAGAGLVDFRDGGGEIVPGLSVEVTGGHTAGHQMILLADAGRTIAFPGDILPSAAHANPAWITAFDTHPIDTVAAKIALADRARREGWIVALEHDPAHVFGRIDADAEGRTVWVDVVDAAAA